MLESGKERQKQATVYQYLVKVDKRLDAKKKKKLIYIYIFGNGHMITKAKFVHTQSHMWMC